MPSPPQGLPGGDKCCDCGAPGPNWASSNTGALICLPCSGVHRCVLLLLLLLLLLLVLLLLLLLLLVLLLLLLLNCCC